MCENPQNHQTNEALKRIPVDIENPFRFTFYSQYDKWEMHMIYDNRTCPVCELHQGDYMGNELRTLFPYHEVESVDRIRALVHPNCRCQLVRY